MRRKLSALLVCVAAASAAALISHPAAATPAPHVVSAARAVDPTLCGTDSQAVVNISAPGVWLGIIPNGIPQDAPQGVPNYMLNPLKMSCTNLWNLNDRGYLVSTVDWRVRASIPVQYPPKTGTWGYHIGYGWCAKYFISTAVWGGAQSPNQRGLPGLRFYGWMGEGPHRVYPDSATIYVEAHPLNTGWC